jgi:hypothetical protein
VLWLPAASLATFGSDARAQLSTDQQACISALNAALFRVAAAQPREVAQCIDAVNGARRSAYAGFDPSAAGTELLAPIVFANSNGFTTSLTVQAVTAATSVRVDYAENREQAGETPNADGFTLPNAGDSRTLVQSGTSGANDWNAIGRYVGAARITADKPIVGIVNIDGPASMGDSFYTYEGFTR